MSRNQSNERTVSGSGEALAVIREEQFSPTVSSVKMDARKMNEESSLTHCHCAQRDPLQKPHDEDLETLLKKKEESLRDEFDRKLEREIQMLKDRFDFILENEQIRASYMLCEAHRERREKISALQTQLECKNLAGLMYVLCSERTKSKMEKMQLTQEYTKYIDILQETLIEAQALILRLVNGYKTGSKIDESWRNKMKDVIKQFQNFVHDFVNDSPEMNQYFFDLTKLIDLEMPEFKPTEEASFLTIDEPIQDIERSEDKSWWNTILEGKDKPFVVFGDMADFEPDLRRDVLKSMKSTKTPKEWQHYVINDKFVKSECPNANFIKEEYLKLLPKPERWECATIQTERESSTSQRMTQASVDIRGNMGSILRIIASSAYGKPATKATILGARDSMEIASATKLREKARYSSQNKVVLNIGNKRVSKFDEYPYYISGGESEEVQTMPRQEISQIEEEEIMDESVSALGSLHNDSLQVIQCHVPDRDATINYEKVCPMEECQRMQVDSFIRTLPPYMQGNPYTHFENTYEAYEPCTPEQLDILRQRIEGKRNKSKHELDHIDESPLKEWSEAANDIFTQTSGHYMSLPPCTCPGEDTAEESVHGIVYKVEDLLPVKRALNEINKEFFFDSTIEFNRFKVLGQVDDNNGRKVQGRDGRLYEIENILRERPSLCDIFQGNTK